ncbi:MAG: TonB-dependent receptor [Ignavibacteriaceae bacterium]
MKFLPILLLFFFINLYPQTHDSFKVNADSSFADSIKNKTHDSLLVKDTLKIKPDTLIYIFQKPLEDNSLFIDRNIIDRLDYRYTGDFFKPFSFGFVRDFGFTGQPNEIMLYGVGFGGISFLQDGILQNNMLTNSFDLNEVQSESVDSVEIIPLPRGFLFGSYSNAAAVNFISRDITIPKPYSRIKYYQGPYGEALIDMLFNERFFKKFSVSFDVTNRKTDSSYTNSAFSTWQANVKLKYFLSDKINLQASYNFVHSEVGLNGGVNVDSVVPASLGQTYFDFIGWPVNYPYRHLNKKRHYFNLRLLSNFFKNSYTDINLYYKFSLDQLNNPADTLNLKDEDKNKTYGISLKQNFNEDIFNISLNGNYEETDYRYYSFSNTTLQSYPFHEKIFSVSSILSANLIDSSFVPAVFFKYSNQSQDEYLPLQRNNYSGIGFDLTYNLPGYLKFYLGYSTYQTGSSTKSLNNFEAGSQISLGNLFVDLKYFRRNNFVPPQYSFLSYDSNYVPDMSGIGINLNYSLWKIYLETAASFYSQQNSSGLFYEFPKVKFTGGIYYRNFLFDSNLDLKTGLVSYYTGKMKFGLNGEVAPSLRIDFTLAGEIRKVAMVYFTWENLFNNTYYIIPYYPMPRRGIRFGIAWELFN